MSTPPSSSDSTSDPSTDQAVSELIPAATVILVRDDVEGGIEVLMLKRNSKIAFGGAWVFPGGRVDPTDAEGVIAGSSGEPHELAVARNAAAREAMEEATMEVAADAMVTWSHWVPPPTPAMSFKGPRKRFATWFFVARAPEGDVAIDGGEIHAYQWIDPTDALADRNAGKIELAPPTFVTLSQLDQFDNVDQVLAHGRTLGSGVPYFATRLISSDPFVIAWQGDRAYETGDEVATGPRHRIVGTADGPWTYIDDRASS